MKKLLITVCVLFNFINLVHSQIQEPKKFVDDVLSSSKWKIVESTSSQTVIKRGKFIIAYIFKNDTCINIYVTGKRKYSVDKFKEFLLISGYCTTNSDSLQFITTSANSKNHLYFADIQIDSLNTSIICINKIK